ncbi:MAG: hypothetical protein H6738_18805 [Alphaproteobacteria bacterium]|nr:hypothetical protein [Alphaproteobacteria bacterium]MCB9698838.1 hypothetical protein [Alphaproteobacteria bacterium]
MFWTWLAANAATWTVDPAGGGDFTTIADAVAASSSGDTIEVGPGTYTDPLRTVALDLTLVATGGPESTHLEEPGGGSILVVDGGRIALEGFDLTSAGQCIRVRTGAIEIRSSVLRACGGALGGALRLDVGTTAVIEQTSFLDNASVGDGARRGAGIYSRADLLEIRDSTFSGGEATGDGGAIVITVGVNTIEHTTFDGNRSGQKGGAILVEGDARTFDDGAVGTGVVSLTVTDSTFTGNTAVIGGGAMWIGEAPEVELSGNRFCANDGGDQGGALRVAPVTPLPMSRNVFQENVAGEGGGAYVQAGELVLDGNDWLGNEALGFGGGLGAHGTAVTATHEVFAWSTGVGLGLRNDGTLTGGWNAYWGNDPGDLLNAEPGEDDVLADPLLGGVSLDGDCTNDDYTPSEGSPLIDAGDPAQTDEDGTTRDIGVVFRPAPPPADDPVVEEEPGGCGCDHGLGALPWSALLAAAVVGQRRSRRRSPSKAASQT